MPTPGRDVDDTRVTGHIVQCKTASAYGGDSPAHVAAGHHDLHARQRQLLRRGVDRRAAVDAVGVFPDAGGHAADAHVAGGDDVEHTVVVPQTRTGQRTDAFRVRQMQRQHGVVRRPEDLAAGVADDIVCLPVVAAHVPHVKFVAARGEAHHMSRLPEPAQRLPCLFPQPVIAAHGCSVDIHGQQHAARYSLIHRSQRLAAGHQYGNWR